MTADSRCERDVGDYRFDSANKSRVDRRLHRFIEVSVGIIVALLVVAIWPERRPLPAKRADE